MKAAAIIAQEKVQREEVKMFKSGSLEFSRKGASDTTSRFECKLCGFVVIETIDQFDKLAIVCPYHVLDTNMSKVTKVHDLVHKLLQQRNKKILDLEVEKTKLFEKIIKLNFSMEDQKTTTLDAKNSIALSEHEQKKLVFQVELLE